MSERHEYELWQGGIMVAAVEAGSQADAIREIMRYAMVYSQDGPVEIKGDLTPLLAILKASDPPHPTVTP